MMLAQNTHTTVHQFMRQSLLYSFFSILAEDLDVISSPGGQAGSIYVRRAVEFIQNNYCYPIRICDVADYVCINRSYLYTLFHRELSVSPQEYLPDPCGGASHTYRFFCRERSAFLRIRQCARFFKSV